MSTKALIMFAREPKLGEVKTRLAKSITAEAVLSLYEAFIKDVANLCQSVSCDARYLYYQSDDGKVSFLRAFSDKFILMRQRGKDLGERLYNCFVDCEKGGYGKTVIVGSDCLTMTSEDLRSAFSALDNNDYVLGPTTDGGFYLVGAKKPHAKMFNGVKWGTEAVFRQVHKNLKSGKRSVFLMGENFDIDRIDDLYTFAKEVEKKHVSLYTKTELKRIFGDLSSRSSKRTQTSRKAFPI